ncbi:MAG: RHS repeat protein, partial [Candidatus Kerfeldbacteria bacterium]|nr:RHS repeat protein [Candidatus Kerfeldbacteria bacterium]
MQIRRVLILIFWVALFLPVSLSHAATAIYTYDSLNRVVKEEYENGRVIEYTYDAVGNRLTSHSYMKSFEITVDTVPSGLQITADGVNYTAPHVFTWEAQSTHTVSTPSPQSGGTGVQYVFSSWSDSGAQSHSIAGPAFDSTFTATLQLQNLLTMSLTTAGSGTITPTPAGTVTACAQYLCAWYTSGTSVTLTVAPASGYLFFSWSGDCTGSGNCVVTLDAPRAVTAMFLPLMLQDRLPTSKINLQSPWSVTGCT